MFIVMEGFVLMMKTHTYLWTNRDVFELKVRAWLPCRTVRSRARTRCSATASRLRQSRASPTRRTSHSRAHSVLSLLLLLRLFLLMLLLLLLSLVLLLFLPSRPRCSLLTVALHGSDFVFFLPAPTLVCASGGAWRDGGRPVDCARVLTRASQTSWNTRARRASAGTT